MLEDLRGRAVQIQPCSALTKEGVKEGMEWVIQTAGSKK
jgi:ADP-ribosylation factor-like protein 3